MRRRWPARLWDRLAWGVALTPLVFMVLVSVDLAAALAVALAFAPELVATAVVLGLLFLLVRRLLRAVRHDVES